MLKGSVIMVLDCGGGTGILINILIYFSHKNNYIKLILQFINYYVIQMKAFYVKNYYLLVEDG